ncbi:MAG TPA: response regulator, partial [Burkholderiaceae bacterium]|nr:response regulator [Burkholderiaceae bacterium]
VFRPIAQDKGIDLAMQVDAGVPASIVTDSTRLQQVLKNLLSNALKFTERGGVSLRVQRAGAQVAFAVKDTGIGIPAEQHETIFEAFRQADGTTNRKYGGTGLGLSISRDLARLLGGELTLDSAPGRGSTFTLVVPERLVAVPEGRPAISAPAARPRRTIEPAAPIAAALRATAAPASGGQRTLLIVEDDAKFASVLEGLARELDFHPLMAETGEQALALANSAQPDAIVLDVALPDRSGLSVLDVLKHRSATRHIPVHIVSGSDYSQAALQMGAAGYDIKPVDRDELAQALRRLETKLTQKAKRILVVEDDPVARDSTCRLLAGSDVETVAVGTAADAMTQLGAATFDCMVLDLSLPDRSGFDLLEDMSASAHVGFPPVIVYTGRSLSRDEEQRLRKLSRSIIIKGARSPERLLDEVTLFLHQVESELPAERQRMLRDARHREAVFEGRRILIVEDDVRNIFALSSVLEPRGAKVEIARNGKEALDRLSAQPPIDLVLMDVMMPEMDGLEATRRIRAQRQLANLPIIALTAKAMADDRDQCLAAGANDYIAKPLDIDKLLSLTRVWMPK